MHGCAYHFYTVTFITTLYCIFYQEFIRMKNIIMHVLLFCRIIMVMLYLLCGFWNGGYQPYSCSWIYGNSWSKGCCNTSAYTLPGATIWSDMWAAYNAAGTLPGISNHDTVNHSINFVNPVSGSHTNTIGNYLSR